MSEKLTKVRMIRENLDNIPDLTLPSDLTVRYFKEGDEDKWVDIHKKAEKYIPISHEIFRKQFHDNYEELKKRQCFICDSEGNEIGTATAWYDDIQNRKEYGRIHWVAIVPEMRGKGLSKSLMTILCNRLKELGHEKAYLTTATVKIPAISLYLKFGFLPEIKNEKDRSAWEEVGKSIKNLPIQ